jgi:hypothetical protein
MASADTAIDGHPRVDEELWLWRYFGNFSFGHDGYDGSIYEVVIKFLPTQLAYPSFCLRTRYTR